ncbi:MAG: hypothetical protein IJ027_04670 [Oscillospiraceae bacterium]|nr:hypothetical protein [Oscillospiraceae bacterium]
MKADLIGAAITLALGVLIAVGNYFLSAYMLKKRPEAYASTTVLRQMIQVLYLVAVLLIGEKTPADVIYLLIGAAVGITVPMFYFTGKLVKLNDALNKQRKKDGESDG